MIRGELIQAKSNHVASEHQREVAALGKARARDADARARVRTHEDRFWREIARASTVSSKRGSAPRGERASALHRAIEAHHVLSKAKGAQREVIGEVQHQVARVIKTKHILSVFEKLRAKERAVRAHKLADRRAEEVDEVAVLRRAQGTARRAPSSRRDEQVDDPRSKEVVAHTPVPLSNPGIKDVMSTHGEGKSDHHLFKRPESLTPSVSLQSVSSEVRDDVPALRVRMESAGAPLSCRLESTTSGRVEILVEAAHPTLVTSLEREQRGIVRRLSEMGIKVGGFEIRRDLTMKGGLSGFFRRARRAKEEADENSIA